MTEREIEQYLIKSVKEAGGETRKLSYIGRIGAPDRMVLLKGIHFVELKSSVGKLSGHQFRELSLLHKHGASTFLLSTKEAIDAFVGTILK